MNSRVPVPVVGVDPRGEEIPRKAEEGDSQLTSLEVISSLVTQLLRAVQEGRRMDETPLPKGESVLEVALDRGVSSLVNIYVSDPLEHSGLYGANDVVPGLVLPEPLEHSVLVFPLEKGDMSVTDVTMADPIEHSGVEVRAEAISPYHLRVFSEDPSKEGGGPRDHQGEDVSLPVSLPEVGRVQPEDGEAIVVGAVGSQAPWFLTGWANDMEVQFMIDTGCQMTILATSVFEQMCSADPLVRSSLRLCRRRLVSADSPPLTVKGSWSKT